MTRRSFTVLSQIQAEYSFDSPRSLYEMGEFNACLRFLGDRDHILRVRCLLRLGKVEEVIRADSLAILAAMKGRERFSALVLLASAFHRKRMTKEAVSHFSEAHRLADELGLSEDDRAELHYLEALRAWSQQQYDESERLLDRISSLPEFSRRVLDLRGWIAAGRGDLRGQMQFLAQAIDVRDSEPWAIAIVLQTYADLANELHDEEHYQKAASAAQTCPWSTDMDKQRFYTYRSLAIMAMHSGRTHRSFEYMWEAQQYAQTNAEKCLLWATKSRLADCIEDPRNTALEYRLAAMNLVDNVAWANESDARIALLILAEQHFAHGEPLQAKRALDAYRSVATPISPVMAHGLGDQRLLALETTAFAFELLADGNHEQAREAFKDAFQTFYKLGYRARAVRIALAGGRYTNSPGMMEFAAVEIERSFKFAACFKGVVEPYKGRSACREYQRLSETKKAIIAGLFAHQTQKEIAATIGISQNKVRNHIVELFDRFTPKIRTHVALIEKLRKMGVE